MVRSGDLVNVLSGWVQSRPLQSPRSENSFFGSQSLAGGHPKKIRFGGEDTVSLTKKEGDPPSSFPLTSEALEEMVTQTFDDKPYWKMSDREILEALPEKAREMMRDLKRQANFLGNRRTGSGEWNFYGLKTPLKLGDKTFRVLEILLGFYEELYSATRQEPIPQPDGTYWTEWSVRVWHGD